jgi:membrane-associated phospholipid phosphatase
MSFAKATNDLTARATNLRWSFLKHASQIAGLFVAIYYSTDLVAGLRHASVFMFHCERNIPFVPQMYVIYFSALCLPFVLLLYFDSTGQIQDWASEMRISILFSGAIFLILPTSQFTIFSFSDHPIIDRGIQLITGRHNLFPSMHVALSTIIVRHIVRLEKRTRVRLVFWMWLAALIASTVITRQHNVIDVFGGIIIALAAPMLSQLRVR